MLDKLERSWLGRLTIPNLALMLVFGQGAAWIISKAEPAFASALIMVPARVLQGEIWRLVTFLFMPPPPDAMFGDLGVIFGLLLLYIFGRRLESDWGAFRFNAFIVVGWLMSVGVAFVVPYGAATNFYLMTTVFLAFAYLYPDYELLLFFVLPVKVKWLALLAWLGLAYSVYAAASVSQWMSVLMILASISNFFLFLGPEMVRRLKGAGKKQAKRAAEVRAAKTATHTCATCGLTDLTAPEMSFRYCSKCSGGRAYCKDHLRDHEHVQA